MNKEQLNHILMRIWGEKKDELLLDLFSEECVIHSSIGSFQSAKEMQSMVKIWMHAFPDLEIQHQNILQDGSTFVVQWIAKGTHQGEFLGLAPTHRSVQYRGCSFYTFKEEKVIEYSAYVDRYQLEKQLRDSL